MYCINCGNKMDEAAKYCPACGSPNENVKDLEVSKIGNEEGENSKKESEVAINKVNNYEDGKKKEKAQVLHIISWICFVLVLLSDIFPLVGYFFARASMKRGGNAKIAKWANLAILILIVVNVIFVIL